MRGLVARSTRRALFNEARRMMGWHEQLRRGWAQVPSTLHGADPASASLLAMGIAALAVPTLWRLSQWVWPAEEQGHGPLVLMVSTFLMLRRWPQLANSRAVPSKQEMRAATMLVAVALLFYALGRSQAILMAEVGSLILLLAGLVLMHWGRAGLLHLAFPLAFLGFMVPLPEVLVAAVTAPMKAAVSAVAAASLQWAGQPVARTGVMLTAGPYQLLVADACAGLTTLFTLEALGLLYLHIRGYTSAWRNAFMAVLVVPIAFIANVLRVITLVMVTLWWGDAAGQGFAHNLAGMTLFIGALLMLVSVDAALGVGLAAARRWRSRWANSGPASFCI